MPAHEGIQGNEEADAVAKNALMQREAQLEMDFGLPQYFFAINPAAKEMWRNKKKSKGRKFYGTHSRVGKGNNCSGWNRTDAAVITRWAQTGKHPHGQ